VRVFRPQAPFLYACGTNITRFISTAPFLVQFFSEPMMAAMPYVDILFGNETVSKVSQCLCLQKMLKK